MKSYDKLLEENRAMKLQLSVISDDSKRVVEQQKKIEKLKAQNAGLVKALHTMDENNKVDYCVDEHKDVFLDDLIILENNGVKLGLIEFVDITEDIAEYLQVEREVPYVGKMNWGHIDEI